MASDDTRRASPKRARLWFGGVWPEFRLKLAAPALGSALRGSIATIGPLAAGFLLGHPGAGRWVSIGGLDASLVDTGGPYRERAIAVSVAIVLMGAGVAGGTLAGAEPVAAALVLGFVAFIGGLGRVFGRAGASVGLVVTIAFVVGAGHPGDAAEAVERGAAIAGGGAIALVLTLLLWPLRPHGPLLRSVAATYEAAARLALAVAAAPNERAARERAEAALRERQAAATAAIAEARRTLGETRESADGADAAGERLLVLVRGASRLAASLVALRDGIETASARPEFESVGKAVSEAARAVASAAMDAAAAIDAGGREVPSLERLESRVRAASASVDAVREKRVPYRTLLDLRSPIRALEAAASHVKMAADVGSRLERPVPGRPARDPGVLATIRGEWARVRSQLTLSSVVFRHALRLGAASALAFGAVEAVGLARGYWTAIAVLVILQPDLGGTRRRAFERTAGTVIASVSAPLLGRAVTGPEPLLALLFVLAFAYFLVRGRRYWMGVALVTTLFLLLIEATEPSGFSAAAYRVGHTIFGGTVALVAGYQFWPSSEKRRFAEHFATALRASARYFERVAAAAASGEPIGPEVFSARNEAEVEAANAEASYQRLLAEKKGARGDPVPRYALVTYNHRFCRETTALAVHLEHAPRGPAMPGLEAVTRLVAESLDEVASAAEARRAPGPLPPLEAALGPIRARAGELEAARLDEIRRGATGTATKRAAVDAALADRELDRLVREVIGIHAMATSLWGVRSSTERKESAIPA